MRELKIYSALYKPRLIAYCERVPFTAVTLTCAILAYVGGFTGIILALILYFSGITTIALLNRKDPFFFKILFRYLKSQEIYSSSAFYPGKPVRPNNKI